MDVNHLSLQHVYDSTIHKSALPALPRGRGRGTGGEAGNACPPSTHIQTTLPPRQHTHTDTTHFVLDSIMGFMSGLFMSPRPLPRFFSSRNAPTAVTRMNARPSERSSRASCKSTGKTVSGGWVSVQTAVTRVKARPRDRSRRASCRGAGYGG